MNIFFTVSGSSFFFFFNPPLMQTPPQGAVNVPTGCSCIWFWSIICKMESYKSHRQKNTESPQVCRMGQAINLDTGCEIFPFKDNLSLASFRRIWEIKVEAIAEDAQIYAKCDLCMHCLSSPQPGICTLQITTTFKSALEIKIDGSVFIVAASSVLWALIFYYRDVFANVFNYVL